MPDQPNDYLRLPDEVSELLGSAGKGEFVIVPPPPHQPFRLLPQHPTSLLPPAAPSDNDWTSTTTQLFGPVRRGTTRLGTVIPRMMHTMDMIEPDRIKAHAAAQTLLGVGIHMLTGQLQQSLLQQLLEHMPEDLLEQVIADAERDNTPAYQSFVEMIDENDPLNYPD